MTNAKNVETSAAIGRSELVNGDFARLRAAQAVSDAGSAASTLAIPMLAANQLHATPLQLGVLSSTAWVAAAVIALPLGQALDTRKARPVLVWCDLGRLALLLSVPIAAFLHALTLTQLYLVSLLCGGLTVAFNIADRVHLPRIVPAKSLAAAYSRLGTTSWLAQALGAAGAGLLFGLMGGPNLLIADGVSFAASAVLITRMRSREDVPTLHRFPEAKRASALAAYREIRRDALLIRLILAGAFLTWSILYLAPVEVLYLLRSLHFSALEFGLATGVPVAAGALGAAVSARLLRRISPERLMTITGWSRAPWELFLLLARPGVAGLVLVTVSWCVLLFFSAIYAISQNTIRQLYVPPDRRGAGIAASTWIIGLGKPLAPLLGGVSAAAFGVRGALVVGAIVILVAPLMLIGVEGRLRRSLDLASPR